MSGGSCYRIRILLRAEVPEKLLSLLYATQTDNAAWQPFVDGLNAQSTVPIMMFGHNLQSNEGIGLIAAGLRPDEISRYQSDFADKNPWMHMNVVMPTGTVGVSDQALERRDLFKTEFYNDWLRRQEDIVAGPFMMCHRTANTFVGIAAACQHRNVDTTLPKAHALIEALAPHLLRAINYSTLLTNVPEQAFSHLHATPHAVFLLTRSGRLSFMNRSAIEFKARHSIVSVTPKNQLVSSDSAVSAFLAQLAGAIASGRSSQLPAPLLFQQAAAQRFVLHAHLFPDQSQAIFPSAAWCDPVVGAVVVTGGHAFGNPNGVSRLARSFGATPAEAKLAQSVYFGMNLNEYADAHELSRHTVRNQMRSLMHKFGCRGQLELLHYISSLLSPFSIDH